MATIKKNSSSRIKKEQKSQKKNPFSQSVSEILIQANELDDSPLLLDGYDEYILGYNPENNSIIYDGLGIVNQIVDERMKEDERDLGIVNEWEDYYDEAYEWVTDGLVKSVVRSTKRKGKWINLTENNPTPIILMRFLTVN